MSDVHTIGPRDLSAAGTDSIGQTASDILVWVTDGYLRGMEYAWVSDDVPEGWPRIHEVVLRGPDGPIMDPVR